MEQTINNIDQDITYTLSIQVSLNGLSFCTLNSNQEIKVLEKDIFGAQLTPEQVLDKIKYLLDHNPSLKRDFKTIEIIYHNDLYTVVPKALFNEDILKSYLQYNIKVLETDFIAYDELDQHDMVTVYVPYTNINNFFFDTFGSFTYKHTTTVLIDRLLTQQKNNLNTTVFAHMQSKSFDLVIVNKGKLILANSYSYETKEDFLYYLLFTAEQLQLNPEEFKLTLLGDIRTDSEYSKIAYTYIRHVDFGQRNNSITLASDFDTIESHEHFVLLSNF